MLLKKQNKMFRSDSLAMLSSLFANPFSVREEEDSASRIQVRDEINLTEALQNSRPKLTCRWDKNLRTTWQ